MESAVHILHKLSKNSDQNLRMQEIAYLYLVQSRKLQASHIHNFQAGVNLFSGHLRSTWLMKRNKYT